MATGSAARSGIDNIDPDILDEIGESDTLSVLSSGTLPPASVPISIRKRSRVDLVDTPAKKARAVPSSEVSEGIKSLVEQLRLNREYKQQHDSQKSKVEMALELLCSDYIESLSPNTFNFVAEILENTGKATVFLTLQGAVRDRWLNTICGTYNEES